MLRIKETLVLSSMVSCLSILVNFILQSGHYIFLLPFLTVKKHNLKVAKLLYLLNVIGLQWYLCILLHLE